MSTSTAITKLNEHNYRTWTIEAKDLLKHLNVWRVVDGSEIVPRPPTPPKATESISEAADTVDIKFKFKPESKDPAYLTRFDNFLRDWRAYCNNYEKATGTISGMLEPSIRSRYTDEKFDDPKVLWDTIKSDFEEIIKQDGEYEMAKLTTCKLESYPSVTEWITAQEKIINDLAICGIKVEDRWRRFYLLANLPNTDEWRTYASTLKLTGKTSTVADITSHLLTFEASLRRAKGLPPDAALFVSKKGRGKEKATSTHTNSDGHTCSGCGKKGHTKDECWSKKKWAAYAEKKAKEGANLALDVDYRSFLF